MLELYRKRIVNQFFPARQAIRDYRRATADIVGTLDLMLVYVENGTHSTIAYGDTRESLYSSLASVLAEVASLVLEHPDLYSQCRDRLRALVRQSADIGCGFSDAVNEVVGQLDADMEAER